MYALLLPTQKEVTVMIGAKVKDLNVIMLKIMLVQHAQQIQDMIEKIKMVMDVTKIGQTKYVLVDGQEMDQNLIENDIDNFDNSKFY